MSGSTPKRSMRISDEDWEQIAADASAAGKERTEYLLDCWREARDTSRKLPRLYVAARLDVVRQALEQSLKQIEKIVK